MTEQIMQMGLRKLGALVLTALFVVPIFAVVQLQYPQAARGDHVDHYYGIGVPDP